MWGRTKKRAKRQQSRKIEWLEAADIKSQIERLLKEVEIDWVKKDRVIAFRSHNANTRAYARIWGLNRIWQQALGIEASYVIEVISEKFDKLSEKERDKIILHEIAHIPRNFSGSLVPHTRGRKGSFHDKLKRLISSYEAQI